MGHGLFVRGSMAAYGAPGSVANSGRMNSPRTLMPAPEMRVCRKKGSAIHTKAVLINQTNLRFFAFDTMRKPAPYCTPAMLEMLSHIVHGTPPVLDSHGKRVLHEALKSRGWIDKYGKATEHGRARVQEMKPYGTRIE